MTVNETKMLVIYGSQTGQSKSIAENLASEAGNRNYNIELLSMEEAAEKLPWTEFKTLIVITSSTGDGDPPENAIKLWRKLRFKDLNNQYLSHLEYALLGLGDTNYTTFGGFPRAFDKQLLKLGARKIYKSVCADDAVGLETTVDPWIENLWPALLDKKECVENIPPPSEKSVQEVEKVSFMENMGDIKIRELSFPLDIVNETKPVTEEFLITSPPSLQNCELKIPILPESFLELTFKSELDVNIEALPFQNDLPVPGSASPITDVRIKSAKRLSGEKATKTALEITVDFQDHTLDYQPGDTIGVVCPNDKKEVEHLLEKLGLLDKSDIPYHLNIRQDLVHLKTGNRLKYQIPPFLPNPGTLRHALTRCCEIRSVPRKALLRVLAHYTSNEQEKRRILELCSLQGSDDYTRYLRQPNVNILDLLGAFPSCRPPIERLLEHWPRLLPRPYSISSSPLTNPGEASFVFNVIEFPHEDGRSYARKGVATGWIQSITQTIRDQPIDLSESIGRLKLTDITIPIFLRTNTYFKMPSEMEKPLVLIGPGTGVAPFIGFLHHRELMLKAKPDLNFGPVWLIHGCRTQEHDFLYREELKRLHAAGIVTRLHVCFSREHVPPQPRYVQDVINQHQAQIVKLVMSKGGFVFVCGDANNMAKDVMNAFTVAIQTVQGIEEEKAKEIVLQLQKDRRYLQDIWT